MKALRLVGNRSRDDREHGAGVRRDDGLLPGRRRNVRSTCSRRAARNEHVEPCAVTTRRKGMFGMPKKAKSITASCSISTSARSAECGWSKTAAGSDRSAKAEGSVHELMLKPVTEGGYGKTEDELSTRYHVKIGATIAAPDRRRRRTATETFPRAVDESVSDATPASGRKPKWSTTVPLPTWSPRFPE